MRNEPISRVMTPEPATVRSSESIAAAERVMREQSCHHVPVVDETGKVVGIVSAHDLMKAMVLEPETEAALGQPALGRKPIEDIMRRSVVVLPQTATLLDAAKALSTGNAHAVPVVAPGGVLAGIVTSSDLIEMLVDSLRHPVAEASGAGAAASTPDIDALRSVYRATVHYLESGSGELEHTRLMKAVADARERMGREVLSI